MCWHEKKDYWKSQKCKKRWKDVESNPHHQHFIKFVSRIGWWCFSEKWKGDTQISIRVDITNGCSVCKGKLCFMPSFHWSYYTVGCYYMADYTYEDPNKAIAAPAWKRKHWYLLTPCRFDQTIDWHSVTLTLCIRVCLQGIKTKPVFASECMKVLMIHLTGSCSMYSCMHMFV